jgi:hypothetical protein
MKSEWGKNTLYLWENQEKFAPLLDAWEIANRNNIFNDIGLKRLPFIEKDYEAIKDCIRRNEHVAITLYRDFSDTTSKDIRHQFDLPAPVPNLFEERLLVPAANH